MKDSRAGKSDRKPWQKGPGAKRPGGHSGGQSGGRGGDRPSGPDGHSSGPGGPGRSGHGRQPPVARRDIDDGLVRIFGSHAVEAALNNRHRRVVRLLATENAEIRLAEVIAARRVLIDRATPGDLDHLLGADTVHQGLLLEAQPLEEPLLAELIARAKTHGPLVLLDHVTDPHNFGAVLRSAAAFGTAGLIMTRRHSPPLNGVLAKAASGALDLVPVLPVQNLAKTMEELKAQGFQLIGLEGASDVRLEDQSFDGPCAIVLGAEGKGLRELTAQTCDRLVSITTGGSLHSLNVSNAAAVTLHWAAMSRRRAGTAT